MGGAADGAGSPPTLAPSVNWPPPQRSRGRGPELSRKDSAWLRGEAAESSKSFLRGVPVSRA